MTTDPRLQEAIINILNSLPALFAALAGLCGVLAAAIGAWVSSRSNARKLDHNTEVTQAIAKKLDENTEITKQIVASNTGSFPAYQTDSTQGKK